jgi:hypothetical protein
VQCASRASGSSRLQKSFHAWLQPGYEPFRFDYNADRIDALAEERAMEWKRIGEAPFLTIDEQREAVGYGPTPRGAAPAGAALLGAQEMHYRPDQPRVPAGGPEGGQWTSGGGGGTAPSDQAGDDDRVTLVADNRDPRRYTVDLYEEEGYGHTLRDHVAKTEDELLAAIESERTEVRTPFGLIVNYKPAIGSFDSRESANDFVNRTLEANTSLVDEGADGKLEYAKLEKIFGYRTGKEAYLKSGISTPIVQWTHGVRVVIHADANSARGYRVRTAFPINLH